MNDLSASSFDPLTWAVAAAALMIVAALVIAVLRLVRGPTGADRIMALDLLTGAAMAAVVFLSIRFDFAVFLDVALAFAVVAFLSTAILARVLEGRADDD